MEYLYGAPPELIREIKEFDDTLFDNRPSKRRLDLLTGCGVSNHPNRSMIMRR